MFVCAFMIEALFHIDHSAITERGGGVKRYNPHNNALYSQNIIIDGQNEGSPKDFQ